MKIVIFIALLLTVCISNGALSRDVVQHVSSGTMPSNVNDIETETDARRLVLNEVNIGNEYVTQTSKVEMPATDSYDLLPKFVNGLDQNVGSSVESEQKDRKEESDRSKADENTTPENTELPLVDEQFRIYPVTSNADKNEKHDTMLYKTYDVDAKPSDLKIIKEDTIIHDHVNRLPPNSKIRIRRKRRNSDDSASNVNARQQDSTQMSSYCVEKRFWETTSFYFAIMGWSLAAITTFISIVVNWKFVQKCNEFKRWRREINYHDIEAQNISLRYHKLKARLPTMDVIDEVNEFEDGYIPEAPPPMENKQNVCLSNRELQHNMHLAERRKIIKRVTLDHESGGFTDGISYAQSVILGSSDREKVDRKSAEKRSVIKGHTVEIRRPSLVEEIQFAKSVILEEHTNLADEKKLHHNRKLIERRSSDSTTLSEDLVKYAAHVLIQSEEEKQCNRRASEKRRVIKEATSNERRGSLSEGVMFARSVILPPHDLRELDEDAQHRRQLIRSRHESSGRRMSLHDDILIAKKVILPANEMQGSAESISRLMALVDFETRV